MKSKLRIGDKVNHPRHGSGVIIDQWGSFPLTDERGRVVFKKSREGGNAQQMIDCSNTYDILFEGERKARSLNACWVEAV